MLLSITILLHVLNIFICIINNNNMYTVLEMYWWTVCLKVLAILNNKP